MAKLHIFMANIGEYGFLLQLYFTQFMEQNTSLQTGHH